MQRLFLGITLLISCTFLLSDVWYYHPDPTINQGDWRALEYHYYDWQAYGVDETITSPFYQFDAAHLNAINLGSDSDFQPEDGWHLYAANFGEQEGTGSGFPFFALYNRYTGLLRIFIYKTMNAPESYTFIAMEVQYFGNSLLFSIGEEDLNGGVKALDKRDELGECSFVSINEMGTSYNNWYYIDINLMYDPVERCDDPTISIRLYGSEISTIETELNMCSQYSSTNVSNSNSVIELGKELYSHYKDGSELGEQVQNHLNNQYINVTHLEINPQNEIFSIIAAADIITELLGGANALYGLFKFLTAGGGGSGVSSFMQLHGNLDGTMETINNLRTTDIYESFSGRTTETHYPETMGVFNLIYSPQVEHAVVKYGDITGAHTYRVTSEDLEYIINPYCGLNTSAKDIEVALEFDVSFINGHWSWIEEATGHTFEEIIGMGCLDEIATTSLNNGIKTRYCTQFVPLEHLQGIAFTCPFSANSVSLKVRSILEKDDIMSQDDIVLMANFAVDLNDIGEIDEFFEFTSRQRLIPVYEDLIFTDQEINIENVYSVECGSDLRFHNCIVNFTQAGCGINVNHGQLIFNNCQVNMNGNFITASGSDSEVILETGTLLNMDDCNITLSDQAHFYLEESILNMNNSTLQLSGSSRVNLTDNSQFNTVGHSLIIGSTCETWFCPADYYNVPFPNHYGVEENIPGDRITIENSLVNLDAETEIRGINGARWDGIYFLNCSINAQSPEECGQIRGTISDINFLDFENSRVSINSAEISDIGQMKVHDDSHIYLYYTDYHDNTQGIYTSESEIFLNTCNIHNNGGAGLIVTNSFYRQTLLNSNIYENEGIGLEINNCFYNVFGSNIFANTKWGYTSMGTVQNLIHGNSSIYNNGYAELAAIATYFPQFQENLLGIPTIYDDEISSFATDLYLLMALGPVEEQISLEGLIIDTNNEARFFPTFDSFMFDPSTNMNAYLLYDQGIEYYLAEEYLMAMETMKDVITLYPDSREAKKALALLPYLNKAINGSSEELGDYIDQLQEEALQPLKTGVKAVVSMFDKVYDEAIIYFEEIIADPPDEQEQLLAELNEAFCFYQLVNSGERDLPLICKHKPVTGRQLNEIQHNIKERLLGIEQSTFPAKSEFRILNCRNYPNPFNPETVISFQASELTDTDQIELSIYNLKGQKIKHLSFSPCPANPLIEITWNGTDEYNKPVPSGVYFYQVSVAGRRKTVKKCLLLK